MPEGLFITYWQRDRSKDWAPLYCTAVLDRKEQSFSAWYLQTIQKYDETHESRIVSAIPITREDIKTLQDLD